MKIFFFTDPHIGLHRAANTTMKSRELLREHLYDHTFGLVNRVAEEQVAKEEHFGIACLGDLFDTYSNEERYLKQGADILKMCDIMLAGNHDMSNREGVIGSMELLEDLGVGSNNQRWAENSIVSHGDYGIIRDVPSKTIFFSVPHQMNHGLFEEALISVANFTDFNPEYKDWSRLLLLHCNVGEPHDHDVRPEMTSLWLLPEMQKALVERFDYVLVGHEHKPQSYHGGKLLVLGNVYPIGFGEIADRFYYDYDTETKQITSHLLADMKKEYLELEVDAIMGEGIDLEVTQRLVQITGRIKPQDSAEVARGIKRFWKNNPHLFAVRAQIEMDTGKKAVIEKEGFVPRTLKDKVSESVQSTPFGRMFDKIVATMDSDTDD